MKNITALNYIEIRDRCFYLLKETKKFNQVFKLSLNYHHINNLEKDIIAIKKSLQNLPACFLICITEPITLVPTSKVGLEFVILSKLLKKYNIFNHRFLVTNFMSDSLIDSINFLNNNFYDWHFEILNISLPPIDVGTSLTDNDTTGISLEECIFKLSHLNRTHRMHRQLYSKFLIQQNIHVDNLIAINVPENNPSKKYNISNIDAASEDWFYNKNLLDLWQDTPLNTIKNKYIDEKYNNVDLNFLKKACLCVVSETMFDYPFTHITEKTLQPILVKRPFIVIGPPNTLKELKRQGFKTFNKIVDESYDEIKDPNERMEKIMDITKQYNKKTLDEAKQDLMSVNDEVTHNYKLVISRLKDLKKELETSIIKYVDKCKNIS